MPEPDTSLTGLTPMQWKMMAAVHEQLLPSEAEIPGAREINAAGFLRLVMADPRFDSTDREYMRAGAVELEDVCRALYSKSFLALGSEHREAALRRLEQRRTGRGWLAELLEFLIEALLGDPSHGGNPDGVGWQWMEIHPAFPRPPAGGDCSRGRKKWSSFFLPRSPRVCCF